MNQLLYYKSDGENSLRIEYTGNKYSIAGCRSGDVVVKIVSGEKEYTVKLSLEETAYLKEVIEFFIRAQIEELTSVHLALTKKIEDELQGKSDQYIK